MLLPSVLPSLLGQERLFPLQQIHVVLVQLALLLPIIMLLAVINVLHAVVIRRHLRLVHLDRPLLRPKNLPRKEQEQLILPLLDELGQQTFLPLLELGLALFPMRRRCHGDDGQRART